MAMLSPEDAFGLTEERKKEWCLLSISTEGHPTYGCPGCWKQKLTVVTRGAELPLACASCAKELKRPARIHRFAVPLLVRGGHANLVRGTKELEDTHGAPQWHR
jgi:hypothetical protein